LLAEISPTVLLYGSVWVLVADGIFAGMAAFARTHHLWLGAGCTVVCVCVLLLASRPKPVALAMSLLLALLYAGLIYRISRIVLLAVVVLLQIGLMHYVAFSILRAHWMGPGGVAFRAQLAERLRSR
jgi:hypothetical protein